MENKKNILEIFIIISIFAIIFMIGRVYVYYNTHLETPNILTSSINTLIDKSIYISIDLLKKIEFLNLEFSDNIENQKINLILTKPYILFLILIPIIIFLYLVLKCIPLLINRESNKVSFIFILSVLLIVFIYTQFFTHIKYPKIIRDFRKNVENLIENAEYKNAFLLIYTNNTLEYLTREYNIKQILYSDIMNSITKSFRVMTNIDLMYRNYNFIYDEMIPIYSNTLVQINNKEKEYFEKANKYIIYDLYQNKYKNLEISFKKYIEQLVRLEQYYTAYNIISTNIVNIPRNIDLYIKKDAYLNIATNSLNKLILISKDTINTQNYQYIYTNVINSIEYSINELDKIIVEESKNNYKNIVKLKKEVSEIKLIFNNTITQIDIQRHRYLEKLIQEIDKMNRNKLLYRDKMTEKLEEVYHYSKSIVIENRMPIIKYLSYVKDVSKKSYHQVWEEVRNLYKRELETSL